MDIRAEAVLFDMDGTLVDSTAVIERVWSEWALARGLDPAYVLAESHGLRTDDSIRLLAPHLDAEAETAAMEAGELGARDGIVPTPGAAEILAALPPDRWAVVTSASRELARMRLDRAGLPSPRILVSADDVSVGKPDPQGYLKAARLGGWAPADCLVVEDSLAGMAAGRAGGMQVLGLATTVDPGQLDGQVWVPDLRSLRLRTRGPRDGLLLEVARPA